MTDWPILSTVTFLPLVGALLILLIKDDSEASRRNIRNVALLTTVFVFILSLVIWAGFDNSNPGFRWSSRPDGWAAVSATIWAWMVSPSCSWCCPLS